MDLNDLISRKQLIQDVREGKAPVSGYAIIEWLQQAPAFNEPRRKWICAKYRQGRYIIKCPWCDNFFEVNSTSLGLYKSCPACGKLLEKC